MSQFWLASHNRDPRLVWLWCRRRKDERLSWPQQRGICWRNRDLADVNCVEEITQIPAVRVETDRMVHEADVNIENNRGKEWTYLDSLTRTWSHNHSSTVHGLIESTYCLTDVQSVSPVQSDNCPMSSPFSNHRVPLAVGHVDVHHGQHDFTRSKIIPQTNTVIDDLQRTRN